WGVPLCLSSSESRGSRFVEGSVAEHGEQDADAVSGEAEEGLGVGFDAGSAAVVVGPGGGIVEGCERGEEHRSFQLPVPGSGGVFAVDRRAGLPGRRSESGVGGQVTGGGERAAVTDGGQEEIGRASCRERE